MDAYIKAISYYLPEREFTNEELIAEFPEWNVEKVSAKTGILKRHIAGIVRTGLLQKMTFTEDEFNENEKLYPFGYGTPEDIADFIVFLLSPASRWMTGQRIVIDGGRTLN